MKYKLLGALVFLSQLLPAQHKPEGVKLISATVQNWIQGASPGRAGTTYAIKVKITAEKPVLFKNLWIGKEPADFDVQTFFKDPNKKPAMGDSVLLVHVQINKQKNETKQNIPVPIEYKGEALLEYYVAGRPRYLEIKKFEKLVTAKGL